MCLKFRLSSSSSSSISSSRVHQTCMLKLRPSSKHKWQLSLRQLSNPASVRTCVCPSKRRPGGLHEACLILSSTSPAPQTDPRFDGNVRGNIQQPPHAAGVHHPSGARSKIDVDMIPSPVYVNWVDQRRLDSDAHAGIYATCSREPVPLPLTDCRVLDQGNCSPRFMRASTYILPTTDDLAQSSHLPLGLIVQPLAPTAPGEHPVPVADFSNLGGPPRCGDCRAYINPWCTFVDGGTKFKCNLCGSTDNPIPPEYYSYVDPATGQRLDPQSRPELSSGSVDFIVPEEYWVQPTPSEVTAATELLSASKSAASASEQRQKATESLARQPEPLKIVFAIDVSWTAGRSGMLFEVLEGIRDVLYGSEEENEAAQAAAQDPDGHPVPPRLKVPPGAKIAIITYDRTVHFYNLKVSFITHFASIREDLQAEVT